MTGLNNALLLLGCPELPVQTGIALYLSNKLVRKDFDVTITGTKSAINLMRVSDPEGNYAKKMVDLDLCIGNIVEKRMDFDRCFVFIHNDAGISYLATMRGISDADLFAIVFGSDAEMLASMIEFECEKIVARTAHNPIPLKKKIDEVL
ncbi:MAG TPA: DUF1890 domain-containing protein [Methanosarcinales archaeon]|nr:DUF1890 domain-containing protein [Methanosarcinales archaeon]